MLSSCLIYCSDIDHQAWNAEELESLNILYFKFDLFVCKSPENFSSTNDWSRAEIECQRLMADLSRDGQIGSYFTLSRTEKHWLGNIDVFVNFPEALIKSISEAYPYRKFWVLAEILKSDPNKVGGPL